MLSLLRGCGGAGLARGVRLGAHSRGVRAAGLHSLLQGSARHFQKETAGDYWTLLKQRDAHWFCFYYTISFGGFVGLASSYVLYFKSEFGLAPVQAGDVAALCTAAGALLRPVGGAVADRIGGIRALYRFYTVAGIALSAAALGHQLLFSAGMLFLASGALGMANGSVFQLLPQRFGKDLGVMTGLVGAGGGVGAFTSPARSVIRRADGQLFGRIHDLRRFVLRRDYRLGAGEDALADDVGALVSARI